MSDSMYRPENQSREKENVNGVNFETGVFESYSSANPKAR